MVYAGWARSFAGEWRMSERKRKPLRERVTQRLGELLQDKLRVLGSCAASAGQQE